MRKALEMPLLQRDSSPVRALESPVFAMGGGCYNYVHEGAKIANEMLFSKP